MIIGNWKVESDPLNVTLSKKKKRTSKTGKPHVDWEVCGYFSTLQGALEHLLDQKIRATDIKTLESVLKEIRDAKNSILKASQRSIETIGAKK